MSRVTVLGVGRIGEAIAVDLAADERCRVRVADRAPSALESLAGRAKVETEIADLSDPAELARLAEGEDLVVGSLPSALGFEALRAMVAAGARYVDISFFEQDPFELHELAREHGAIAVVDCGLAPGLGNLALGWEEARLDRVDSFLCQVGGLPVAREAPWEYRAPFAPRDVIAEYTRPARWVKEGRQVVRPALSGLREIEFPGVGRLEAFDTDGLRTLLATTSIPDMREQTLRYPGHVEKVTLLRESGFFSPDPVEIDDAPVVPLELSARLLERQWRFADGEPDFAALRLVIEGRHGERRERVEYTLLDRYDESTGLSAMARTTGFTCTAVARRVLAGEFARPGVSAPEHVGRQPGCFRAIEGELAERGIRLERRVETD